MSTPTPGDEGYATERAWAEKMRQEEADSNLAEARRLKMAEIPHKFWGSELIPNFCARCGCSLHHPIHTRKEDK